MIKLQARQGEGSEGERGRGKNEVEWLNLFSFTKMGCSRFSLLQEWGEEMGSEEWNVGVELWDCWGA